MNKDNKEVRTDYYEKGNGSYDFNNRIVLSAGTTVDDLLKFLQEYKQFNSGDTKFHLLASDSSVCITSEIVYTPFVKPKGDYDPTKPLEEDHEYFHSGFQLEGQRVRGTKI